VGGAVRAVCPGAVHVREGAALKSRGYREAMTDFTSVAPVLPTRDVQAALARYERLGFEVSIYGGGDSYGHVRRGKCLSTCRKSRM
jgi:hypothetical protein